MAIDAPEELVIPAVPEIVFDKIGCLGMGLQAVDKEHSKFLFCYSLQYYKQNEDGTRTWATGPNIDVVIEDLFAATDGTSLSTLPDALLSAMVGIAQQMGKL